MSSVAPQKLENTFRIAIIATILLLALMSVYGVLGVYGDGPLFLYTILTNKSFWDFDFPRIYIQYISQAPVVIAVHFGVKNLTSLTYLHSFGVVGIPLLIWCAALYQQLRLSFFWAILLAFSVTFLSSGFFSIGEYNITYALAGYCFATLLKVRLGNIDCIALLLAAIALTHSYEAMVFLGPTLLLLCILKIIKSWNSVTLSLFNKITLFISALLFLLAAYISAMSIANPRVPENLVGSIYNIKDTFKSTQFHFTIFMVVAYFIIPKILVRKQSLMMYCAVAISGIFICMSSLWNAPGLQYVFRTTSGVLLCTIFLMTLLTLLGSSNQFHEIEVSKKPQNLPAARYNQSIISFALWMALLIPFIFYLFGFSQWIKRVEASALNQSEWIEIGNIDSPQLNGLFVTSWSTPALSIILRGNPSAGLLNNSPVGWQPFDPLTLPGNTLGSYHKGHPLYIYMPSK